MYRRRPLTVDELTKTLHFLQKERQRASYPHYQVVLDKQIREVGFRLKEAMEHAKKVDMPSDIASKHIIRNLPE